MGRYGDPDALDAAARGLAADADAVRRRADALDRAVAAVTWQGPAAAAFRRTVGTDTDALRRASRELDEAAAVLRAHAAEVRERLARIRALEDAVPGWFDSQLGALTSAARAAVHAALEPPWSRWAWRPGNLPSPGDLEWLDVGDYLRARGVRL